jgi:hypothetical protein
VYGWSIEWITIVDAGGGGGGLDVSAEMEIWNLDHEFDKFNQFDTDLIYPTDRQVTARIQSHDVQIEVSFPCCYQNSPRQERRAGAGFREGVDDNTRRREKTAFIIIITLTSTTVRLAVSMLACCKRSRNVRSQTIVGFHRFHSIAGLLFLLTLSDAKASKAVRR